MINNNSESKRMTKIFEEQDYFTHDLTSTKNNDIIKNKYSKDNNIPIITEQEFKEIIKEATYNAE